MHSVLGPLWFFLPAAIANMMPVVAARILGKPSRPVDFGRSWRGRPIFGNNKTWRGLAAGTLAGGVFFLVQAWLYDAGLLRSWAVVDYALLPWWLGFVMGLGALCGDLAKSFFKRRLGIGSGQSWIGIDQMDYIVGGILFTVWFVDLHWGQWLTIVVGYLVLVVIVNHIAYFTGVRSERW